MAAGGNSTKRSRNSLADRKERAAGRRSKMQDDPIQEFAGHKSMSAMAPAGGANSRKGATHRSTEERGIAGRGASSSGPTDIENVGRSTRPARKRKA